jgi:hypothetical protein
MENNTGQQEMTNSDKKLKLLNALADEMNCGCPNHGLMWQSNCTDCAEANSNRFDFFYDFGKAVRIYLLEELVCHPDFNEFRIYYDGVKLVIHPMNTNGKTLDVPLFQDPR